MNIIFIILMCVNSNVFVIFWEGNSFCRMFWLGDMYICSIYERLYSKLKLEFRSCKDVMVIWILFVRGFYKID